MIFCTIGTQAPFDRFLKIVDEVAAELDEVVIAQVYKSRYEAKNIRLLNFFLQTSFRNFSVPQG